MRAHAALSVLALLAVALSGCASDDPGTVPLDAENPPASSDGGNETADGNTPQEPANGTTAPNTPPTADLVASTVNGTAPLNVTFTLDGSDADGDDLTWTFTVGNVTEEGTTLPTSVDVTLGAGNHTATLTVDDGGNQTVASVDVTVAAGGGAKAPGAQSFTGSWVAGNPGEMQGANALLPPDVTFPAEADGVTHVRMDVDAGTWGLPFFADFDCNALLVDSMYFYDASGTLLARLLDLDEGEVCEIGGTVPEGATLLIFSSMGGGDGVSYAAPPSA